LEKSVVLMMDSFDSFCGWGFHACGIMRFSMFTGVSMKKILLAGVSVLALSGVSAFAADLPTKAPAYVAAPAPMFNWNGCYIGVHAGGGELFDDTWAEAHGSGGVVGGQLGCNYQTGQLVLGIEGEGFWSGMKATWTDSEGDPFSVKNKSDWDIAARMGVAFDRALVYGKAGWVWGNFNYHQAFPSFSENANVTKGGLLMGLGLEYAVAPNWTVKFEYNYMGFNSKTFTFAFSDGGTGTADSGQDKHIFKFGLNYKFGDWGKAPVVARY
jgi:outer membrane immunogenic protein